MAVIEEELDIIGVAVIDPRITEWVHLAGSDFGQPAHGAAWEAIRSLHRRGITPDPSTINDESARSGIRVEHQLVVSVVGRGTVANVQHYADIIREGAHRRRLAEALIAARRMLDDDAPLDEIAGRLSPALATQGGPAELDYGMTLDAFVDQPLPANEWIIPNLLGRGDRAVITGAEGWGKTMLIRQLAICAATGLHPFDFSDIQPQRVLMIDVENPKPVMVKTMAKMRNELRRRSKHAEDRMRVIRRPQGMDLGSPRGRLELHALCRRHKPSLLVIGPAYKLYIGGSNQREEDLARTVTSALDGLREEFNFALILEHHSPHGIPGQKRTTRPIGSSLWQRWPEFGLGLARSDKTTPSWRVAAVEHWRGMRDERPWPEELEQGQSLPWADLNPAATLAKYPAA